MLKQLAAVCCAVFLAACATSSAPPVKVTAGVLVTGSGMTLYTFDKDVQASGRSSCNGQCAVTWPPLMASADAKPVGDYTLIAREGGGQQWAYKGKPLYTFIGDQNPNDMRGKGMNGVWQVATQ
jgi:predicted lipoprotein with Yx(FWY)xxD motif